MERQPSEVVSDLIKYPGNPASVLILILNPSPTVKSWTHRREKKVFRKVFSITIHRTHCKICKFVQYRHAFQVYLVRYIT